MGLVPLQRRQLRVPLCRKLHGALAHRDDLIWVQELQLAASRKLIVQLLPLRLRLLPVETRLAAGDKAIFMSPVCFVWITTNELYRDVRPYEIDLTAHGYLKIICVICDHLRLLLAQLPLELLHRGDRLPVVIFA